MLAPARTPPSPPRPPDHPADQLLQGVFEPPSGVLLRGIGRGWPIICALAVLGALAGVALGLRRESTYTAAATLQIGQVNPNSPGFYSYVSSAAALATAFSRGVSAEPVLGAVHRKLGLPAAKIAARVSAEPLPLSPAFRVFATGPSAATAIALANASASALVAYEAEANDSNPEAESLLNEYRGASLALHHASASLGALEAGRHGRHGASAQAVESARAERDTAAAKVGAISNAYTAAVTSQAPRRGLVSLLAGATTASSNRRSKVEVAGFVGLLAGVVFGCLAAALRERRRSSRGPGAARPEAGARIPEPV